VVNLESKVTNIKDCGRGATVEAITTDRHEASATLKSIDYNVAMTFILNN